MRAIVHVCTQCARIANDRDQLPIECRSFARRVYSATFRIVGNVIEVDGVEYESRAR